MSDKIKKDQPTRIRLAKAIEKELNYKRFLHSLGVAETAAALAMRYDADVEKAEIAGILHDCAKYMDEKELIGICKKRGVAISDAEYDNPSLLHAKAGAILAQEQYDIDDPEKLKQDLQMYLIQLEKKGYISFSGAGGESFD